MKKLLFVFILISSFSNLTSQAQVIVSVAGITTEGYLGDNAPAVNCNLHWPESVALDTFLNLYIADANNNVIRKIDGTGNITTIVGNGFEAGTGTGGFGGDGGPASAAKLYYPSGVAIDKTGKIFIADQKNNRIRMVDPATGNISTFAGTGVAGFGGDGMPAASAKLNRPTRVTIDTNGNIYIADAGNHCIRKVDIGGNIWTFAGTGNTPGFNGDGGSAAMALLNSPQDMAVDVFSNVYIADYNNNRIRKVDGTGLITTFAGYGYPGFSGDGGPASAANLFLPSGIVTDTTGNIYFSDFGNARVRKISPTGIISSFAGNGTTGYGGDRGPALSAELSFPQGLASNARGGVYIADKGNNRIRFASTTLSTSITAGSIAGIKVFPNPADGIFNVNVFSAIDEEVKVTICNLAGQKIREITKSTNEPFTVNLDAPSGIYFLTATTLHGNINEKVFVN